MKGDRILINHGGGGRLSRELIEEIIVPIFDNSGLSCLEDSSLIPRTGPNGRRMVMTTDSHVVRPLFFPGGDIGKLAVAGTVNDLATAGAEPVALSVGLIIEEGFSIGLLEKIIKSMKRTADLVPVSLVTGDTKVVEKGRGDGVYISTTGVGILPEGIHLTPVNIEQGDAVLINGPIGNHEAAIICARNDFSLDIEIESDCTPLYSLIKNVLKAVPEARCARDPTRGGVAAALTEIVESTGLGIMIEEEAIPVDPAVRDVCEILGMDPLLMANEGKMIVVVPGASAEKCLEAMKNDPSGRESSIIGYVHGDNRRLSLRTRYGTSRIVTMPMGTQLPRIC